MKLELIFPRSESCISLHTPEQRRFSELRGTGLNAPVGAGDWSHLVRIGAERTVPRPVQFRWRADGNAGPFRLRIARDREMRRVVVTRTVFAESCKVANFRIGERYFWCVENGAERSEIRSFTTADAAPRWIQVHGVSNVRDMGGWRGLDGRRVRQGMLYRGGEFDKHMTVTPRGRRVLREDLKLAVDLDIRGQAEFGENYTPPLGPEVRWIHVRIRPYLESFDEPSRREYAEVFRLLLNPANYPCYFHCWGGADRTGTLALLLNGALGVSEDDLHLDYELTSLSIWDVRTIDGRFFNDFRLEFMRRYGETTPLPERCVQYWLDSGITADEIARFRELMLETEA